MTRRYFGTDGIRGTVGEYPITPDFVMKLGWAVGKVFAKDLHSKVVIGKDTRVSGYMFESALEAGLSAAGVDIQLLGPMPTPGIAYLTRTLHAQAGIVISASHNPFHDNGIKFFSAQGTKLPDDIELAIEAQLDEAMSWAVLFEGMQGVTAKIHVNLRRLASINEPLIITSSITRKTRKVAETKATVALKDGTLIAEGTAKHFVTNSSKAKDEPGNDVQ